MESEFSDSFISNISKDINFPFFNFNINETDIFASVDSGPKYEKLSECDKINGIPNKDVDNNREEDDAQSLFGSDFMFSINSDSYEDFLSDDCLESILDGITFYNEEEEKEISRTSDITVNFNNDKKKEKEIPSDSDIYNESDKKMEEKIPLDSNITGNKPEYDESINLVSDSVSVKLVPDPAFNCDIVNNPENGYTTENLENIVPNCNAYTNSDVNNSFNITSVNKISEAELLNKSFHNYFSRLITDKETNPTILNKQIKNPRFDFLNEFVANESISVNKPIKRQIVFCNGVTADKDTEPHTEDTPVKSSMDDCKSDGKDAEPIIIDQLVESLWVDYINGLTADEMAEPSIIDKLVESLSIDCFNELTDEKADPSIVDTLVSSPMIDYLSSLTDCKEAEPTIMDQLFESLWVDYINGLTASEKAEPSIVDKLIESVSNDCCSELTDEDTAPSIINNLLENLRIDCFNGLIGDETDSSIVNKLVEHLRIDYLNELSSEPSVVNEKVESSKIGSFNQVIVDEEAEPVDKLVENIRIDSANELITSKEAEINIVNKSVESSKINSFNEFTANNETQSNIVDKLVKTLKIDDLDNLNFNKEINPSTLDKSIKFTIGGDLNEFIADEESNRSIVDKLIERLKFDFPNKLITNEGGELSIANKQVESTQNDSFKEITADVQASPSAVDKLVEHSKIDSMNELAFNKEAEPNIIDNIFENSRLNCFDDFTTDEEATPSLVDELVNTSMIDFCNKLIPSGIKVDLSFLDKPIESPRIDYFNEYSVEQKTEHYFVKEPVKNVKCDSFKELITNEEAKLNIVDKPVKNSVISSSNYFVVDVEAEPSSLCKVALSEQVECMDSFIDEDAKSSIVEKSVGSLRLNSFNDCTVGEKANFNIEGKPVKPLKTNSVKSVIVNEMDFAKKPIENVKSGSFNDFTIQEIEPNMEHQLVESPTDDSFNKLIGNEDADVNIPDKPVEPSVTDSVSEITVVKEKEQIISSPSVQSHRIDCFSGLTIDKDMTPIIDKKEFKFKRIASEEQIESLRINVCSGSTSNKNTTRNIRGKLIETPDKSMETICGKTVDKEPAQVSVDTSYQLPIEIPITDYLCTITLSKETPAIINSPTDKSPIDYLGVDKEETTYKPDKSNYIRKTDYIREINVNETFEPLIAETKVRTPMADYLSIVTTDNMTEPVFVNKTIVAPSIDYLNQPVDKQLESDIVSKQIKSSLNDYLSDINADNITNSVIVKSNKSTMIDYTKELPLDQEIEPTILGRQVEKINGNVKEMGPIIVDRQVKRIDKISETFVDREVESVPIKSSVVDYLSGINIDKELEPFIVKKPKESLTSEYLSVIIDSGLKPIVNNPIKLPNSDYANELNVDKVMDPVIENKEVQSPMIDYCNEPLVQDTESGILDKQVERSAIDDVSETLVDREAKSVTVKSSVVNYLSEINVVDKELEPFIVKKPKKSLTSEYLSVITIDNRSELIVNKPIKLPIRDYFNGITGDKTPEAVTEDKVVKSSMNNYFNDLFADQEPERVILGRQIERIDDNVSEEIVNKETESVTAKSLESSLADYLRRIKVDRELEPYIVKKPEKTPTSLNSNSSVITIDNGTKPLGVNKPIKLPMSDYSSGLTVGKVMDPVIEEKQVQRPCGKSLNKDSNSVIVKSVKGSMVDYLSGINSDKEGKQAVKKPRNNTGCISGVTVDKVTKPIIVYKPITHSTVDYSNRLIVNEQSETVIVDRQVNSPMINYLSEINVNKEAEPVMSESVKRPSDYTNRKSVNQSVIVRSFKSPIADYLNGINVEENIEPVYIDKPVKPQMSDFLSVITVDKVKEPSLVDKPMKRPGVDYTNGLTVGKETESIIVKKPRKFSRIDCTLENCNDSHNLKTTFTAENNNSVELNNNNVIINNTRGDCEIITDNNIPTNNLPKLQLKNAKLLDSNAISLMSGNCYPSLPVKKFKDSNGLPSVVLYVKKSQVEGLRKQPFLLNGQVNSLTKPKESVLRNLNEPVEIPQGITSVNPVQSVKPTNTNNENGNYKNVGNTNFSVLQKRKQQNNQNSMELPDKIKKPELFKDRILFTFSVTSRKLFSGTLNFDTFQKDNSIIKYYTGIPKYSYFMALLHCLKLPVNNVVSPFQMLLLTLMKLRLNLDWVDLAYRFGKNVQVVQETFGITLYILMKCLSRLVCWSLKEKRDKYRVRKHATLFVYSIKANLAKEEELKRIFICLSANNHPIHVVSKAVPENECTNGLDILASSGIMEKLVLRDLVLFDKEIDYLPTDEGRSALSVLSDDHDSFCTQPFVNDQNRLGKMEETVSEIKQYKFLYGTITCGWADEYSDKLNLFNDAVTVVCSIVNLCSVLPFTKNSVTSIISERNTMNILIT